MCPQQHAILASAKLSEGSGRAQEPEVGVLSTGRGATCGSRPWGLGDGDWSIIL